MKWTLQTPILLSSLTLMSKKSGSSVRVTSSSLDSLPSLIALQAEQSPQILSKAGTAKYRMHGVVQNAVLEHLPYTGMNHCIVRYVTGTAKVGREVCRYPCALLELETR